MKVFGQIDFDDEQRHREGEDAVSQGIEPALRNKLVGLRPSSFPVRECTCGPSTGQERRRSHPAPNCQSGPRRNTR
jgi:hypothetical protein